MGVELRERRFRLLARRLLGRSSSVSEDEREEGHERCGRGRLE